MNRDNSIENFLIAAGIHEFRRLKIPGDASFRRYERILSKNNDYILMDAPPEMEDIRPFIKIDNILRESGFSAPEILAQDIENGFLLLENFGNDKYSTLLKNNPAKESELYQLAVDVLVELYRNNKNHDIADYSKEKLLAEAMLVPEWYIPLFTEFNEKEKSVFSTGYKKLISNLLEKLNLPNEVLVLRDYHADNLMLLETRQGLQKVGLLDFQDALTGNPAYDLVSLLEDARRDVPPEIQQEMIDCYITQTGINKNDFLNDYHILGAQRNLKIIGIFSRLKVRDNKEVYLPLIPRVKKYLQQDLLHGTLSELKQFLEQANVL